MVLEHCESQYSYMLADVCNYIVLMVVLEHYEPESSYILSDVCNYIVF